MRKPPKIPAKDVPVEPPISADRRLVLLDQKPLRETAGREVRKKMREVNDLSTVLSEFDRTIRPAYERWEAEHLGPMLEEERRLASKIATLEHTIRRVGLEALFTGCDPYQIYEEILQENRAADEEAFTRPDSAPEGFGEDADAHQDAESHYSEEEQEFRSYLRYACGESPDSFGKREYKRLFAEYRRWRQQMGSATSAASQSKAKDVPARVKEIYRILVRRLHPDTGKFRHDAQTERLWHDLQAAYSATDLERMEVLLAITDLHESGEAIRSTLFHLRQVAKEMTSTLRDLKKKILQVKKTDAWKFWHADNRDKVAKKIRDAVEERIKNEKRHLAMLEEEIQEWKSHSSMHRGHRSSQRKKKNADCSGQGSFDF